ncbi:hypothetical protein C8Q73DRAFT_680077 [Cubamyces lactineus]|nr:hypothetical protein C8Q73DRAFT_680077 [Cubamyces lactineus]
MSHLGAPRGRRASILLMSLLPLVLGRWVPGSAVEHARLKCMGPSKSAMVCAVPCAQWAGTATVDSVVGHLVSHEMKWAPRWMERLQFAGGAMPSTAYCRNVPLRCGADSDEGGCKNEADVHRYVRVVGERGPD